MENFEVSMYLEGFNKETRRGSCKSCRKAVFWNKREVASHKRASCPGITDEQTRVFARRPNQNETLNENQPQVATENSSCANCNMPSKVSQTLDIFDQGTCSVCAACEINQYFSIDESYVDYKGTFYSLREVLKDALDLQIVNRQSKRQEICLDCKDKVVKFFHFKRKAKEIQKQSDSRSKDSQQDLNLSRSSVVHNIVKIVRSYTEKCAISKIRIDETSGKLIIESQGSEAKNKNFSNDDDFDRPSTGNDESIEGYQNFIGIKEELSTRNALVQEEDLDMFMVETEEVVRKVGDGSESDNDSSSEQKDESWSPDESAPSTSSGRKRRKSTQQNKDYGGQAKMVEISTYLENYVKQTGTGTCKACGKSVPWNKDRLGSHKRVNCPGISPDEKALFHKQNRKCFAI